MKKAARENGSANRVTVLAIGPADEHFANLSGLLRRSEETMCPGSTWLLKCSPTLESASPVLHSDRIPIVLCESGLPDGNWRNVLEEVAKLDRPSLVIVASRHADERLWAEALNLGAWDVLSKPYNCEEVIRVFTHAWLHWVSQPGSARAKAMACVA